MSVDGESNMERVVREHTDRISRSRRPLREIFPTANGHRLQPCPFCKTPTQANADGLRTCHRRYAHGPDCMFPGSPVSW